MAFFISARTLANVSCVLKLTLGVNVEQEGLYFLCMSKRKHGPAPGTQYKNITRTKLGASIAAIRRLRGISQEELAEKTGISGRMISYYERESENIPASKLVKIADALKVTTHRLLNEPPDTTNLEVSRALLKRIDMLKKLPTEKQQVIIDMIDQLSGTVVSTGK